MLAPVGAMTKYQEMLEFAGRGPSPYPLPGNLGVIGPINFPSKMEGTYKPRFSLGFVDSMPINPDMLDSKKSNTTNYRWMPYFHHAVVIGQPAVASTASILRKNSWDYKYGLIGSPLAPIVPSNAYLPVAPVPTMGF